MNQEKVSIRQESTGAMRSSDLDKERWDLLSGIAIRGLETVRQIDLSHYLPGNLVDKSIEFMWRFLGHDMSMIDYTSMQWPSSSDSHNQMSLLYRGWWCLAIAIQKIDDEGRDVRHDAIPYALPYHAFRRLSRACAEGVTKYGEENWHNGFRTKEVANHAISHMVKWTNGFNDEDDLGHAMWNYMVAAHNMTARRDLNDLLLGENYSITDELKEYHDRLREERLCVKFEEVPRKKKAPHPRSETGGPLVNEEGYI